MSSTCFHNSLIQLALESLPDYPGIRERFLAGFEPFVSSKKLEAVARLLPQELLQENLAHSPEFQAAVAQRLDSEALLEKPYVFVSLNPKMLL
jgi:hypothetical protein